MATNKKIIKFIFAKKKKWAIVEDTQCAGQCGCQLEGH